MGQRPKETEKVLAARTHKCKYDTSSNHRSNLTRRVGAHRVHQQEVLEVFFLSQLLANLCRHRKGADTSRADDGVDLATAKDIKQDALRRSVLSWYKPTRT